MHEKDPVISVIMGIYNCGDTLSEAIECIVHQTFSDWELIMCDDGSNDDTYEIAISYNILRKSLCCKMRRTED